MILVRDGHAVRLQTKSKAAPKPPTYMSWHPSGSGCRVLHEQGQAVLPHGPGGGPRRVRPSLRYGGLHVGTGAVLTSAGIAARPPGNLPRLVARRPGPLLLQRQPLLEPGQPPA